jgi:transposase-like protein
MVGVGQPPRSSTRKGTAKNKSNQKSVESASADVVVPEQVTISLAEIAVSAKEGLLALAVGAGLQVMQAMFAEDVERLCGPKGKHNQGRVAYRHGTEGGSVTLGGRRLPVEHPRVRSADGNEELGLPSYTSFSQTEVLGRLAMERMLAGLSTRRYQVGEEPVGSAVKNKQTGTSKSSISRRFTQATESALSALLARPLEGVDLVALMLDGVHFAEDCCVVALGIDITGVKHPLSLTQGSTENATLARELLVDLRERGLDTSKPILVVTDGAKALRRAVLDVFEHPVLQRCQQHKIGNVKDKLPEKLKGVVEQRMRAAYRAATSVEAEGQLLALARELERTHPGAAASLKEGLPETLTVIRLGLPPILRRTLRSTNPIESMLSVCREHSANVKRWQNGQMALRWCAAGMLEAEKQFRRVNGHLHLPALRSALEREIRAEEVNKECYNENVA